MLGPIFQLVGQGVDKLTQLRDSREEGADLEAALLQALKLLQAGMVLGEDHVWLLRELRCTSELLSPVSGIISTPAMRISLIDS